MEKEELEFTIQRTEEAINKVMAEKMKYIYTFQTYPKYVKLPIALYVNLKAFNREVLINYAAGEEITTFCGLQLCPTYSIERTDEIEVF